ncbi:MAG: Eco57I restriction-modification methylase domain-containing protein [Thermodesulfovibrionales bacterium]
MDFESRIKDIALSFSEEIRKATSSSNNEAEFRTKVSRLIEDFANKVELTIPLREEYTLINGRADAVYNRLIVEYEPPNSLRPSNSYKANQHAINQVKNYIEGLVRRERHKPERLVGVVLDGNFFIFIRNKEGVYHIDQPVRVDTASVERFLKLLASLSTELALIPENLVRDFGENTTISRKAVSTFYNTFKDSLNPKLKTLFDQWSLQFSEVCDYEEASKLDVKGFAKEFGIKDEKPNPFKLFFCIHTYYATFIKLLALQIVHYYAMPKLGTDLRKSATFNVDELKAYMKKVEEGGIFKDLGITNFLEGDFFGWYLDVWGDAIYEAIKGIVTQLSNYSLVTLDVDPEETRDLLKKLYQHLMPRPIRHNLGEYYTPDWLAERLLGMLCGWRKKGDARVPDIRPDYRILDPACGSGTFLVLCIKYAREYAKERMLSESDVLEKILNNIVGFDLNPLAVISARTNYLLSLGDLLQHRRSDINIPVYICDSIMTPHEGEDLYDHGVMKFNTAVGPFSLPKSLVHAQYIDKLANFLEDSVRLNLDRKQFTVKLTNEFPLIEGKDDKDIEVVFNLYEKLLSLEKQGVNGIWARIIKNAFAPLFVGEFDYVAGNPPWVNWEHLPEGYREGTKYMWFKYGMAATKGRGKDQFELGKQKRDISALMTFVSIDKYLKRNGKLGFLITQSVFKTNASAGFRQFKLPNNFPFQVVHVDDMVELNPFEGASKRTSIVIFQKGKPTKYPLPMGAYLYWTKTAKGKSIPLDVEWKEVEQMVKCKQFIAEPVDEKDLTSPWITGRPKALKVVRKILGKSGYTGNLGCNSGGANGVYWVDIVSKRLDGLLTISNITEKAKRKVESIQCAIEPDLLYPLLRSGDLKRWNANSSVWIILPHTLESGWQAISEEEMKIKYSRTYLYFKRFETILRNRSGYRLLREVTLFTSWLIFIKKPLLLIR